MIRVDRVEIETRLNGRDKADGRDKAKDEAARACRWPCLVRSRLVVMSSSVHFPSGFHGKNELGMRKGVARGSPGTTCASR